MANRSSYAAGAQRSILGGTGHRVEVLRIAIHSSGSKMRLTSSKMTPNALYSQRAGTGAEECSVLSRGEPGGAGAAAALCASLSRRRGRFAALCRYRHELAAAWRLRHHRFRPGRAHSLPPAGIPGVSRRDFRHLRLEQFPRGSADSSFVRSGHVLPRRRSRAPDCSPTVPQRRRSCWPHSVRSWPTTRPRLSPRRWKFSSPRLALDLARVRICCFSHAISTQLQRTAPATWLGCGLSIAACILLRPDGGILFGAIGAYWFLLFLRQHPGRAGARYTSASAPRLLPMLRAGVILTIGAFAPLVPWTLRNLHTMHRFQPLAPRYANDSDESRDVGIQSLDQDLDRRLHLRAGNLLEGAGRRNRCHAPAAARVRFVRSSARKPSNSSPTTTRIMK